MRLRFLFNIFLIFPVWSDNSNAVFLSDERGDLLSEKSLLNIGQTIIFKFKSQEPRSVESVSLKTWNGDVTVLEGITNKLSKDETFDIPYVVPDVSIKERLSFDVIVRSKAGGRKHFFINKPSEWEIKKNSFLESLVEVDKKMKVQGLNLDLQKPKITNVVSKKKFQGTLLSFDISDSHLDLKRMRVIDHPATCFFLKKDIYRCEVFLEKNEAVVNKKNIEILAFDRARNLKRINVQNIYNPTADIALQGPVAVEKCGQNRLALKLSLRSDLNFLKKVEFYDLGDQSRNQRFLASESENLKKLNVVSQKQEKTDLKLTLEGVSLNKLPLSKYELVLKDRVQREFLYELEPESLSSKKNLACDGSFLNAKLIQIKEIQE